ncbi:MAG: FdhF/YdeP family oxidoreductase [Gemmataceae bacterium]|nr:FdhF/YdeP family oxidoreductase [Gemmataceae bacterium]
MQPKSTGGGWSAIWYTLRMARRVGWRRLWHAMRAKNTCKTCALGMGGQAGGMRNELGFWPEVCKKSFQAMVADMQAGITPDFFANYSLAQLQTLSPRELEWCGRLTTPVYAGPGDTHYRTVAWDFALSRVVKQLKKTTPDENFFYCSGRSSNEAGFLLQLFSRLYGTNYVNNCSYYCHQASGVALNAAIGTSTATVTLDDVEHVDLFVLIGGNPASNHPRLMRTLMNLRRRGGHVIVINPLKEVGLVNFSVPSDVRSLLFGSKIASLYVQPHIGGDIALLTGLAKIVLERGAEDRAFLFHVEHFDAFVEHVKAMPWVHIEHNSGVDRGTIEQIADYYCKAKNAVFGWTMGITHHEHGVENVHAIVNVALLRGMVGRPGAGLLPIRGHSNVQGVGSMGVAPSLKEQVFNNLESYLKVKLPTTPGLDTMACMRAADEGRVRSAICLGGNLFGSNPDAKFAHRALGQLELVTYLNTTLNTGHAWGRGQETLILPVLARDEEPEPTTQESMFNFVRLSDGGIARHANPRSEVKILCDVADQLLGSNGPVNWKSLENHCQIRQMIAQIIPGYEVIGQIDATKQEFHIAGRTFHEPKFKTPTGKAHFRAVQIPLLRGDANQLRLMTIRSEGQFNTVVYEEEDIYRGQERRDVILMSRADIERLGLQIDQRVTVTSAAGAMPNILVRAFDIKPGNAAMYFPEANVLVPAIVDSASKTPAFKSVLVRVVAIETAAERTERIALKVV